MITLFEIMFMIVLMAIFVATGLTLMAGKSKSAVEHTTAKTIDNRNDKQFDRTTIVAQKANPTVASVKPTPTPVIIKEEKIENHYHFKELNTGLMSFAALGGTALLFFILYKVVGFGRKSFIISKAKKKSEKLIKDFDTVIEDVKSYLSYSKTITEQMYFNKLLVELNKDDPRISQLQFSNQLMNEKLTFIERKMLNDFKK